MLLNKIIKNKLIDILMIFICGGYFFQSYRLFSEVNDFTTPGSSYIIQVLEFTNYRATELSILLIEYFILISIISTIQLYRYFTSNKELKKRELLQMIGIYVILFIFLLFITNIFFPVYVLLSLIVIIIIISAFYIATIFWDKSIHFEEGDILLVSSKFDSENEAQLSFNKFFTDLNKKYPNTLDGKIYEIEGKFYFEIYTLTKMTLENKGDIEVYENI